MELGVWKIISVIALPIMSPSVLAARPKGTLAKASVVSDTFCIVSDLDLSEKLCTFAVELQQ